MRELTKSQKRHLRELSGMAWERELAHALAGLHGQFAAWQTGQINAWALNELVHQFHNGISRKLYKTYADPPPTFVIASALIREVLAWDDVPEDCEPLLRDSVKAMENYSTASGSHTSA